MAIVGLGTEIVECARLRAMIEEHGERFLMRVYLPQEIRHCQSQKNATEQFAAYWASKEAVLRALGFTGRGTCIRVQVEICRDGSRFVAKAHGDVRERLNAAGPASIMLTAAFTRSYATATAIVVRDGP